LNSPNGTVKWVKNFKILFLTCAQKPKTITTPVLHQKIDRVIEQESPRQNLPINYALPVKEARISNVPRSVYAALSNVQFPGIFDREGDPPVMVDVVTATLPSRAVEVNDGLNTNEIIVQFLAFKCLHKHEQPPVRKIFFTLQFYRFQQITTEELLLSESNNTNGEPNVLMRLNDNGEEQTEQGPGFSSLLRGGKEAVQCTVQCPVVFSALPGQPPRVTALLYVRLANIGHPSSNQIGKNVC
uniref:Arrestin_C domain-containing protein n=1 Tax=Haemonchus placei TaxID=6290 RepID=A0A0N4VUA5_HAEPC